MRLVLHADVRARDAEVAVGTRSTLEPSDTPRLNLKIEETWNLELELCNLSLINKNENARLLGLVEDTAVPSQAYASLSLKLKKVQKKLVPKKAKLRSCIIVMSACRNATPKRCPRSELTCL
jgi:hypothetical protein